MRTQMNDYSTVLYMYMYITVVELYMYGLIKFKLLHRHARFRWWFLVSFFWEFQFSRVLEFHF